MSFISLQRELSAADAAALAGMKRVTSLGAELRDFDDTAAVLALCDLVIAVDTSLAHLAGALGRPAWILLPFRPDWRWMLDRPDSPWYPSARLYRQSAAGDWASVVARVREDLAGMAEIEAVPGAASTSSVVRCGRGTGLAGLPDFDWAKAGPASRGDEREA